MIIKWILLGLLGIFLVGFIMSLINIYLEKLFWRIGKWYLALVLLIALAGCFYFMYYSDDATLELKQGIIFVVIEFVCYYIMFPNLDDETHYQTEVYVDFWDDVRTRTKEVFTPGWLSKLGAILACTGITVVLFFLAIPPLVVLGIQAIFAAYLLWH